MPNSFPCTGVIVTIYILQATTIFLTWIPINTNTALTHQFNLFDAMAPHFSSRINRVLQQ